MFQLYRFSPIRNEKELLQAIDFLHFACLKLCKQVLGSYLSVVGNIGIFCHFEDEYTNLVNFRKKLTEPSDNPDQKYFKLGTPITVGAKGDVPEALYTHLYIRKPDPYRWQVGDVDFVLDSKAYASLKQKLLAGGKVRGARVFERPDLDMVELYDPAVDALAYVSTQRMTEKVRVKII